MSNKDKDEPKKPSVGVKFLGGLNRLYNVIASRAEVWIELAAMGKFELAAYWYLRRLENRYKNSGNPLLRGDLFEYAKLEYPPRKFSTAWEVIPEDMRRPLIWDGKLLNGADAAELAKAEIRETDVARAFVMAGRRSILVSILLVLCICYPLSWWVQPYFDDILSYGSMLLNGGSVRTQPDYPQWAADAGVWKPIISWYALDLLRSCWRGLMNVLVFIVPVILLIPVVWNFAFASALNKLWNSLAWPLRAATRDSMVFWKQNSMMRQKQYLAYKRQVYDAVHRLQDLPIIHVGRATGTARSRGDNEAPVENQMVAFDGETIRQHTIILGGTGEGKTRLVIKPLAKRIFVDSDWKDHKMGAYITDGKGTLWQDLLPVFAHRKDVRVIGTDGDEQYGVDLLAGMTPLEVSNTFVTINKQLASSGSDSFWPKNAGFLIMNVAALCRALDLHPGTYSKWIEEKKYRPYSILALNALCASEALMQEAIDILGAISKEQDWKTISEEYSEILEEAIECAGYLQDGFMTMAFETKGSIVAHITTTIGFFRGHRGIAERFCRGTYENVMDVDHALQGGIAMINIGENAHGLVGQIVTTWLKTRLYVLANRRLRLEPKACETTSCALIADEFQLLVTTGQNSDTSFWSTGRQTGLYLIAASQSVPSLEEAIGIIPTKAFLQLMRNKIILKLEDKDTINYILGIAGQANRGQETEAGFFANQALREKALGNYGAKRVSLTMRSGFVPSTFNSATSPRSAFARDYKLGEHDSALTLRHRMEDKEKETVFSGVTLGQKFDFDELLIGKGLAFAMIHRAGCDRTDIVDLDFENAA